MTSPGFSFDINEMVRRARNYLIRHGQEVPVRVEVKGGMVFKMEKDGQAVVQRLSTILDNRWFIYYDEDYNLRIDRRIQLPNGNTRIRAAYHGKTKMVLKTDVGEMSDLVMRLREIQILEELADV